MNILAGELIIEKKILKGDDGYKIFSLRVKEETVDKLEKLSQQTNRSRNELVNIFVEYGLENCIINNNNKYGENK